MTADRPDDEATGPRIGVIHATPLSIRPLAQAFAAEFPEASLRNVLDDSLLTDLQAAGRLTEELERRMERVVDHVVVDEVDAVQFACSGYVPVVDATAARLDVPVRRPDEAMYRDIVAGPDQQVGIVATVQPALEFAAEQLRSMAREALRDLAVATRCVPEAMAAAQEGDEEELARLIGRAVTELVEQGVGSVALAQYSMSPAGDTVARRTGARVLTAPTAAARDLRAALQR